MGIIKKTFGGLSLGYYIRHFIFGCVIFAIYISMIWNIPSESRPYGVIVIFVINTILYPYSRFVYESVISYIMGENVFFVNAILMLVVKFFTMVLCWAFAIFIAPIGLLYLYFYHSKIERQGGQL